MYVECDMYLEKYYLPGQVGNSVCPTGASPSCPHSTFDTQTA